MNDRQQFIDQLEQYVPEERIEFSEAHTSVYAFAAEGGLGVPADVYDDVDVHFAESIGMSSLHHTHRLYREYAHHVLIFKVE